MVDDENMPAASPALWQQGFAVGAQSPACACPLPTRTFEARSWRLGWEKAIQQLLAQDRRGGQATLAAVSTLHVHPGRAAQRQ
jgi:hypothetical protein